MASVLGERLDAACESWTTGTPILALGSWVLCVKPALWHRSSGLTGGHPFYLGTGLGLVFRRNVQMELACSSHRGQDFPLKNASGAATQAPFPPEGLDSLLEVLESLLGSS